MDSKRRRYDHEREIVEDCSNRKYVPIDLTVEILSRLPIKSIGRFISASKSWHDMITSRRFSSTYAKNNPFSMFYGTGTFYRLYKSHIIEVSENSNSLTTIVQPKSTLELREIVGSCNGLLCLRESTHVFAILNPITNECTAITIPSDGYDWGQHNICVEHHGFGYSPSTNEYKLFKGLRLSHGRELRDEYAIFTIGVDERWRKLPPNLFPRDNGMCADPFLCNGAFHWLVYWYDKFNKDYSCMHILAFDIATENTRRLPTPQKSRLFLRLLALNGRLCLARSSIPGLDPANTFVWRIEDFVVDSSGSGSRIVAPPDSIYVYSSEARKLLDCATKSGKIVFRAHGHLGLYCPDQMRHNVIPVPYHYDVRRLYEFFPTFLSIDEILNGNPNDTMY